MYSYMYLFIHTAFSEYLLVPDILHQVKYKDKYMIIAQS